MSEADDEILNGCRQGHMEAFERLYAVHGGRMKSVARNLTGNVADAEDAVQDAFVKIHRSIGTFKEDSALGTWVHRILVNSCYDLMRRQRRRHESADVDGAEEGDQRPAPAADHPLRLTLERSLARLEPRMREVFVLFEIEGFKHREIAEILGMAEGTSKYLLFEAKRELQRIIAPAWRAEERA